MIADAGVSGRRSDPEPAGSAPLRPPGGSLTLSVAEKANRL